ncbi:diguanylate cyclase/phosphodiesterase (GGDEF & EAL domains) with PAS/PAC sensor(s) [hydrothermal vent metagenome]|uniref:Diguanylate cyclase/phosphodiesterase (GGDEF & EAL domains) with PAS/PAC sensor(S) n=1 Tax=hydrothermal vent metagenome TaxID=652676 RepID=A0A1W1CYP1_9ZZZZ
MPIDIENDDIATALKKLKAREENFRQLEKISNFGSWEVNLITKKAIWSENSYRIYGYKPFSIEPTLDTFFLHVLPQDAPRAKIAMEQCLQTHRVQTFQGQLRAVNGEIKDILINAQALYNDDGVAIKLIGITQDITDMMRFQRKSKELSNIIENSSDEIYIVNWESDRYLYANQTACDALGYTKEELLKLTVFDINKELTKQEVAQLKASYNKTTQPYIIRQSIHTRKDGTIYHVQSNIQKTYFNDQKAYVIFDNDVTKNIIVTELVEQQSKLLKHRASHDELTNLANRAQFQEQLTDAITTAKKEGSSFALFFLDIDHFKDINDSLGHDVGDKVLQDFSKKLKKSIRADDAIARLGGDEFTIILHNIKNQKNIEKVANKIIDAMQSPIKINSNILHITTSIGISIYPQHAQDKANLLKFADTAMYKAKNRGRNNYQIYSEGMTESACKRVTMEHSLRIAIKEEQFEVYYQPQIDIFQNKLTGMEALVRWQHPTLGMVSPIDFIPLAEELGLIVEIDRIVMKKAMQQFYSWSQSGLRPGRLSLNLAMQQLQSDDFMNYLFQTLKACKFQKEWLELEVTETEVMNNPMRSIEKLREISDNGISIAIDDFGTGYSSLAYLKKLPLTRLKIDKSFIDDIPNDEDGIAIVKAIIALAKSLNFGLIAEGVETQAQKEFLLENSCEVVQGYIYSKPLPSKEMTKFLGKF